ncbi:MAG: Penicillin-binding protein 1A [Myxococcota bacterium]|nr:Penicillin-binding protein 1A [Myxococcota bacterium]
MKDHHAPESGTPAGAAPSGLRILPPGGKPRPFLWRVFRFLMALFLLWGVAGALALTVIYVTFSQDLPEIASIDQYRPGSTSRFHAVDGQLIGEFAEERRELTPYDRIPLKLVQAFIAAEDNRFFEHFGVDPEGILRAAFANMKAGRIVQGGSTITQQVAKSFLSREKTFTRKFREAILSFRLEKNLTKQEILYIYLNEIFLGNRSYGVQAAARNYFRKDVSELTLDEMTILAGMPQAPSRYSPLLHPAEARRRREYVLVRMAEEGFITPAEAREAKDKPIKVYPIREIYLAKTPYFTEHVRKDIESRYGAKSLLEGGLRVYTTVDQTRQIYSDRALTRGVRQLDKRIGFRGPLVNLPRHEWDAFRQAAKKRWPELREGGRLSETRLYTGLVTHLDKAGKNAAIQAGDHTGTMRIQDMNWAHKPEYGRENEVITSPEQALSIGDVVLVRIFNAKEHDDVRNMLAKKANLDPGKIEVPLYFKLEQTPELQAALVSGLPRMGYVTAMSGGYDFRVSKFNRAVQACRQPGSSFKPIVYAAAVEALGLHPATMLLDAEILHRDAVTKVNWKPRNFENVNHGLVTARFALMNSLNLPTIRLLEKLTVTALIEYARKLGIASPFPNQDLSLALGSNCITLWELIKVYSVFDLLGEKPGYTFIRYVEDANGRLIEDHRHPLDPFLSYGERIDRMLRAAMEPRERVMDARDAYIVTYLMTQVAKGGTAAATNELGLEIAGKTGTTNDSFDAWFAGFTPTTATGVWVGFDRFQRPLGPGMTGGKAALPIWMTYMRQMMGKTKDGGFPTPPGIVNLAIDGKTGLLAAGGGTDVFVAPFRADNKPEGVAPEAGSVTHEEIFRSGDL